MTESQVHILIRQAKRTEVLGDPKDSARQYSADEGISVRTLCSDTVVNAIREVTKLSVTDLYDWEM